MPARPRRPGIIPTRAITLVCLVRSGKEGREGSKEGGEKLQWRQVELVEVVPSRGGFARGVSEMPRQSIANRGDDGFNHMSSIHSTKFVLACQTVLHQKRIFSHP